MPLDVLRNSILEARDKRQQMLDDLRDGESTIITLSLNIPGAIKVPCGAGKVFRVAQDNILKYMTKTELVSDRVDRLGPFGVFTSSLTPTDAKRVAVVIEEMQSVMRLVDIDIYAPDGRQIGRDELGYPARPCLVCRQSAKECIAMRRHSVEEAMDKAYGLLAEYGD